MVYGHNDLSRAHNMARDLESGMVSINEYPITFPQTAFHRLETIWNWY